MIEKIAESDEALLNKFFENGTLSEEDIRVGLKRGIVERKVFPIFSSSPVLNIGVLNVLNFVVKYCPAPVERGTVKGIEPSSKKEIDVKIDASAGTLAACFQNGL